MFGKNWLFLIISLLMLSSPAFASEDSVDEFPEDFSFDDLPDIAETAQDQSSSVVTDFSQNSVNATENNAQTKNDPIVVPATDTNSSEQNSDLSSANIFLPSRPNIETDSPVVSKDKTLTETLKENDNNNTNSILEGTWVEKLTSSNPLSAIISSSEQRQQESQLETLIKDARSREKNEFGKSNASVFDISGVMLRMDVNQATKTLENRGFKKINARFEIPNFIKWRNEEACRNEGIVGYERIEACVINKAKKDGYQYLQYLKYAKFESKEEIEIYFTSTFTENKVYKIVYHSRIADITGNSPKAIYIRNIKVYDFWKKISQKYGRPDNKTTVTWGLGGNKPYLKASTGFLVLEDPMFREMDYTRMSREDQRFIHSDFYNF